ncbi:MAG: aminotransferase class V-fold PLP-dependent enzyme [Vicinamibacterales bacterium]
MTIDRRQALSGLAGIGMAATGFARLGADGAGRDEFPAQGRLRLRRRCHHHINGAFTHPHAAGGSRGDAHAAVRRRATVGGPFEHTAEVWKDFAALINADPEEVGLIPNTSTGENWVVEALELRPGRDNVVTDGLHFEGALVHLMERRKQGLDVRVVMPRDGRIHMSDLERAVDDRTKLVEVSHVAMYNGFQHDLKAVSDLAHAHGAYVYADIIQGVGAVPLDVRATGIDFAAASTYKWLMGDFGLGFMFVRRGLLDTVVRRPHWSYESAPDVEFHWSPTDPKSPEAIAYTPGRTAGTYLRLGTVASSVAAALSVSLPYIHRLGVANIEAHRVPLVQRLQAGCPPRLQGPDAAGEHLAGGHLRPRRHGRHCPEACAGEGGRCGSRPTGSGIAPSVYNDMADIELLDALS